MRNIEPGFRVVGSDGKEVGTIASCARSYCEVNTGILGMGHPIYVPMDAVTQTEGNTVYLNTSSDQISERGWSEPPVGAEQTCGPTYVGTMPTSATTEPSPTGGPQTPPAETIATGATAELAESTTTAPTIHRDSTVICSDGKTVGHVTDVRPDSFVMSRGWFIFKHDVVVPNSAIRRVANNRVYLNVGCAAVNEYPSVH